MLNLPEKIIIFDTEYTAWPGSVSYNWSRPNEYREIVQIGAILVNTKTFKEIGSINLFVKPVKNPALSKYFIDLTGITQKEIDEKGISYKEAVLKFHSWCDDYPIYSFGGDEKVIKENCKLSEIACPFDGRKFKDIKNLFRENGIPVERYESGNITEAFGKKTNLRNHNALNDARIILDGLKELDKSIIFDLGRYPKNNIHKCCAI